MEFIGLKFESDQCMIVKAIQVILSVRVRSVEHWTVDLKVDSLERKWMVI